MVKNSGHRLIKAATAIKTRNPATAGLPVSLLMAPVYQVAIIKQIW